MIGVVIFATASALCGATPTNGAAEPWIIFFRVIQGAGAALMFPTALAIVLAAFPVRERGRALAIFSVSPAPSPRSGRSPAAT